MQPTYYGHHRRNLTITMIVSLIVVVAFVAGIFAIFGKSPENVTPAVIGSKIDKSLGGGRKLLNASVWNGGVASGFGGGSGTEADPYLITSADQLAYLMTTGTTYRSNYFKQTVDIDLNGNPGEWYRGDYYEEDVIYHETLYEGETGQYYSGYTENITTYNSNLDEKTSKAIEIREEYCDNFYDDGSGNTIYEYRYMGVAYVDVYYSEFDFCIWETPAYYYWNYDGGEHTITNVFVTNRGYGASFFGEDKSDLNYATSIKNLNVEYTFSQTIYGDETATCGGLLETMNYNCIIDNCSVTGFEGSGKNVGGLVGEGCFFYKTTSSGGYGDASIRNCDVNDISLTGTDVGGIIGYAHNSSGAPGVAPIENCQVTNFVGSASDSLGGIIGSTCYIYADTLTSLPVYINNCNVSNFTFTGDVAEVGGIAGSISGYIYDSVAKGTITGGYSCGGIVGGLPPQAVYSDHNNRVERCMAQVDITARNVGGIVGYAAYIEQYDPDYASYSRTAESRYSIIEECYYQGDINSSGQFMAGIVAHQPYIIKNCLVQGSMTSTYDGSYFYSGGMAHGSPYPTTGYGRNNIVNANITINKAMDAAFESAQYDTQYINGDLVSGSLYGTTRTSEFMKDASNYASWTDFNTYWIMDPNINDGFPMLKRFVEYAEVTGFDGEGTESVPYIIDSAHSFLAFADYYNANQSILVAPDLYWIIDESVDELDLSSLGSWRPIGYDAEHAFTGHLLGNKTNISNLVVDENYAYAGLFGNVASNASIEWLSVYGDIDYDIATYVGGLAGYVADGASISNCYYMGNITGYLNTTTTRNIGGLIGKGAENNVTSSYAIATHTAYGTTTTTTENIQSIYGINTGSTVGDMKTQSTYTQFGFTFSNTAWKLDIQNDGYPYFNLTPCNISSFNIIRNSPYISVSVDDVEVSWQGDTFTSQESYNQGSVITVEVTSPSNKAIKSLTINGTTYSDAVNKTTYIKPNLTTAGQKGDFIINVVFADTKQLSVTNGDSSFRGGVTCEYNSGKNYESSNSNYTKNLIVGLDVDVFVSTSGETYMENCSPYISSLTINNVEIIFYTGQVIIGGVDYGSPNSFTEYTIGNTTFNFSIYETDSDLYIYEQNRVACISINYVVSEPVDIVVKFSAEQKVQSYVTIVGADGTTNQEKQDEYTVSWGGTINDLSTSAGYEDNYTFIGWVVNGQIQSQESSFSMQVASDTTMIEQYWAVMFDITTSLPSELESIQVTHMKTGLSYNIGSSTQLMAGDWLIKVPTGYTLWFYEGEDLCDYIQVSPDSQGRYIVNINEYTTSFELRVI